MWKYLIFSLLFSISFINAKKQFKVGLILTSKENDIELAFISTINRVNSQQINDIEFLPCVRKISVDDSYLLEGIVCDLISEEVIAIFGPTSETSAAIVSSICNFLGIPHILFIWTREDTIIEKEDHSMTLNIFPDTIELSKAYADIIIHYSWKTFTIVYENEEGLMKLQDIFQLTNLSGNHITVRKLIKGPDYRQLLKTIKKSGENRIILDVSSDKILPILRQASELKMLEEYQSYFLTDLNTHMIDFEEIRDVVANISFVQLINPTGASQKNGSQKQAVILKNAVEDWNKLKVYNNINITITEDRIKTEMVLIHDAVKLLSIALNQLLDKNIITTPDVDCHSRSQWTHGITISQHMKSIAEFSDNYITGKIILNDYGERKFFTLYIQQLTPIGLTNYVRWNPIKKLIDTHIVQENHVKIVAEQIQHKKFKVITRIGPPFVMEKRGGEDSILTENTRFEGYAVDLINNLSKTLKFQYEFILAPDGNYGSYDSKTKKWDGIIGELIEGRGDLGICDLTITLERRKAVDFTVPFMSLGISILYAKPIKAPPNLFSFLSPFALEVWIYMATAYLVISLLLHAVARISKDEWESSHPCDPNPTEVENIWTIFNTAWLTSGSLMGQGSDIFPKSISMRLIIGMWWFFALMMLNSYTANLAAFLTVSRMDDPINSVEDLAKQTKIKYGAVTGGSTLQFFKESNDSTYQKMWAVMESTKPSVFTKSNEEGRDRVLKGKRIYAFLMESTAIEYITERHCELTEVGKKFGNKFYGIALPYNSPYRKLISEEILRMSERGELYDLKMKWWKYMHGGGHCTTDITKNDNELSIEQVGGVFLVLGCGLFVAFLIGIIEFLWNVQKVAVKNKITPLEAFKSEAIFALKFWITRKPVIAISTESLQSRHSSKIKGQKSESIDTEVEYSVKSDKI